MDVAQARAFYRRQDEWASVYQGDVQAHHRDKATWIRELSGRDVGRVLELGCGGGQVAVAAAEAGFTVVAVDIVPSVLKNARRLASRFDDGRLTLVEGDFSTVEIPGPFDVACCWDGFGTGTDDDQVRLLTRVANWLDRGGCALLEVYTPWYWERMAGREQELGEVRRRYGFDAQACRMTDTWWPGGDESRAITQSLRCYSPEELRSLAARAGFDVSTIRSGGAFDEDEGVYHEQVELSRAMQYVARLDPVEP